MPSREIFSARRAIERLRVGLFDPTAIDALTLERKDLKTAFSQGLKDLGKGQSKYLCICGSYGQGKSHSLAYMNRLALSEGYATSSVQLDIREIPFWQFPIVYRAIMKNLSLPDGKKIAKAWQQSDHKNKLESFDEMPHRFCMILAAMLRKNKQLTPKERTLKKHRYYQPKEYGYWLEKALMGHNIPTAYLRRAFKYREVEGYRKETLNCRGNAPYVRMVQSLGQLLQKIGYKGLVLFFDEAESIGQTRIGNRAKSYLLLDQFFQISSYIYPIFAFTQDFFDTVHHEPYDDDRKLFPKDYREAWEKLQVVRLDEFSSKEWDILLNRLALLYAKAYQIDLPDRVKVELQAALQRAEGQETRFKLKALVHKLDVQSQQTYTGYHLTRASSG